MITFNNITFRYTPSFTLFKKISISLVTPGIYGVLGLNGSGKTTFLKLASGLIFPSSGEVSVGNYKPGYREVGFLETIFFVADEFYLPPITIHKFVCRTAPFYPTFDHQVFVKALGAFGITPGQSIKTMSYGDRKKVMISFALASGCRYLFFDEPTNGLDIPSKKVFRKLLASELTENRYVLISTHQVRDLENLLDSIMILHEGKWIANQSLTAIAADYCFRASRPDDNPADIVYTEGGLQPKAIINNRHCEQSRVDLELYFNAMIDLARQKKNVSNI